MSMKKIAYEDAVTIIKEAYHDFPPLPGPVEDVARYVAKDARLTREDRVICFGGAGQRRQNVCHIAMSVYLRLGGRSFDALMGAARNRKAAVR